MKIVNDRIKKLFGWFGTIILLLIIPTKVFHVLQIISVPPVLIGIIPSLLGPAGLLFLILSSKSKYLNLSIFQSAVLVSIIAVVLEFAQLLPRPGFLRYIYYTFDPLDVISSLISVIVAYFAAKILINYLR
ncbi:MAG: hypothetical protein AB9882_14160 [Ignavibacteriaceae bacterium]